MGTKAQVVPPLFQVAINYSIEGGLFPCIYFLSRVLASVTYMTRIVNCNFTLRVLVRQINVITVETCETWPRTMCNNYSNSLVKYNVRCQCLQEIMAPGCVSRCLLTGLHMLAGLAAGGSLLSVVLQWAQDLSCLPPVSDVYGDFHTEVSLFVKFTELSFQGSEFVCQIHRIVISGQ